MIALFSALIAPYFVDWTSYKKEFERQASRIVGQNVEVLGETSVTLLPQPSVTFGGLVVGENRDGSAMMSVDQFSMDIELMPLLKGEVNVVELNLLRPRINLNVEENGAIAWTNRGEFTVDPEQIRLDNFTVTNGEILIGGLTGGRSLSMEQIDGRISANSLYGPWRISADGYLGEKRARIDLTTGVLQEDGSMRVKLSAKRADLPYTILADGPVQLKDGLLRWDGSYEISAQNGTDDKNLRALPIFSSGKFNATPKGVDIPEFRLDIGPREDPYTITGTGLVDISDEISFKIEADGRQIDLDRVGQSAGGVREEGAFNLQQRISVLAATLKKVPVPDAKGTIDLSLPAIVAGDTFIREVSAVISPDKAGWEIKRLSAVFPGNTKFEARGKVDLRETFGFRGSMLVASRQPTGLAAWLGSDDNAFIRKLRSAGFSADVMISDNQTILENLELVLDSAVLKGRLQRSVPISGRPAIVANLEGEEINLDDLRAIFALLARDDARAITSHDLDITLNAGILTGFDISARNVETQFQIAAGSLSVEKLNASDFFGATIASSGRIDDLINQPNGSFKLAVKAQQSYPLLQFLQSRFPQNLILSNLAQSVGQADGIDLDIEINARSSDVGSVLTTNASGSVGQAIFTGVLGSSKFHVETDFEGKLQDLDTVLLDISISLENPDPSGLLNQLGVPVLPVEVPGPLKITGNFSGMAKDGFDSFLAAEMAGSSITARGKLYRVGGGIDNGVLKVTFGSQDIEPLLTLGGLGAAFQIMEAGAIPTSFSGEFKLDKNKIVLNAGEGQIKGHDFQVDLKLENIAASNPRLDGNLTATTLDLPLLARLAFSSGGRDEIGDESRWSRAGFGPSLLQEAGLQDVDGSIEVSIGRSDFILGNVAKNIEGTLALVDGSVNLNEFSGEWLGGKFFGSVSLANTAGIGSVSAQYRLEGINTEELTRSLGAGDFVAGRMDILGSIEGSGRSPAAMVSSLTGSGTIDLVKAKFSGFNTDAMNEVFKAVDVKGFEILDENVLPVIERVIDGGEVVVSSVSAPFIVAAGKLRARNISVETATSNMNAAVEIDLAQNRVKSELSVRFDPGKQWVDGGDPQIVMAWGGDIKAPQRSIDVQPLSGYLSLRNFEREQRRVDLLQASILEKQRLRRDIIVTNARVRYRQRLREEELHRQRQALLAREDLRLRELAAVRHLKMIALEQAKRDEEIRLAAQAERKRLEEIARREAQEAERKRLAEEVRQKRLEEIARRKAEEAERKRLAEEAHEAEKARIAEAERLRKIEEALLAEQAERERAANEARKAQAEAAAKAERDRIATEARDAETEAAAKAEQVLAEKQARIREQNAAAQLARQPAVQKPAPPVSIPTIENSFAKRLQEFLEER